MESSRRPRPLGAVRVAVAAVMVAGLALTGCALPVPGNPVVTARVSAAADQVRACTDAISRTTENLDRLLDTLDRDPSRTAPDPAAVGRFFDGMRRDLNGGCGYWPEQSRPQSAVLLHLAAQPTTRSPSARGTITAMIRSICLAVEGPLDQRGVNLTPRARAVCVAI